MLQSEHSLNNDEGERDILLNNTSTDYIVSASSRYDTLLPKS